MTVDGSYSRIFTGLFPRMITTVPMLREVSQIAWREFQKRVGMVFMLYLLLILGVLVFACFKVWIGYQATVAARGATTQRYEYWKKVVKDHPNYPDGYFKTDRKSVV